MEEVSKKNQELVDENKDLEEMTGALNTRLMLLEERERERENLQNSISSQENNQNQEGRMELETPKPPKTSTLELELCKNDLCKNFNVRMHKLEDLVQDIVNTIQNGKPMMDNTKNKDDVKSFYARAERLNEIENMVKGLNLRMEKIAWDFESKMEETQNLKTFEERISDIEGCKFYIIHGLNGKVIPTVARLQRQLLGIQKRIDGQICVI